MSNSIYLQIVFLVLISAKVLAFVPGRLPALNAAPSQVSISGLSSGAYFSVQFATAFSENVMGVGSVAGGVFDCSNGKVLGALGPCMETPEQLSVEDTLKKLQDFESKGLIASLENIKSHRVYIFAGQNDKTVLPQAGEVLKEVYLGLGAASVQMKNDIFAGHGMPTIRGGEVECSEARPPYLNNCDYDAAGAILSHIYGKLQQPVAMKEESLRLFSQLEFGSVGALMSSFGHVYIPETCQKDSTSCRLHVAVHGCKQGPSIIGEDFVRKAGYNEWAEANDIIILYPAVGYSAVNPRACWDWFGYTSSKFSTREGVQMQTVLKMVQRLTSAEQPQQ